MPGTVRNLRTFYKMLAIFIIFIITIIFIPQIGFKLTLKMFMFTIWFGSWARLGPQRA